MNMINGHALWSAIILQVPAKHSRAIITWAMYIVQLTISTVDRGQPRYFSASKFANDACLLAVKSERSICAYIWAGPESKNFA